MTLGESVVLSILSIPLIALLIVTAAASRRLGERIMRTVRERSALVICCGLAWVMADWLIWDDLATPRFWVRAHDQGWLLFAGWSIVLVGLYHWIARPGRPEI